MPNKQITDLDPLVGGMDDTFNLWVQEDGGGAGSSFAVSWAQLFLGKNAAVGSDGNGTSITIQGGAADGLGTGGSITLNGGDADVVEGFGGGLALQGGEGYYGGDILLSAGSGDYRGGKITLQPAAGTYAGYIVLSTSNPGNYIRWDGPTAVGAAPSGALYVDASQFVKRKA